MAFVVTKQMKNGNGNVYEVPVGVFTEREPLVETLKKMINLENQEPNSIAIYGFPLGYSPRSFPTTVIVPISDFL